MDESPTKHLIEGRIVGVSGRTVQVQLDKGTTVKARFGRQIGCIFGNVVGWQVQVRIGTSGIGTILRRISDPGN